MDIDMALRYMTIEKAIELEKRRFFSNADETINTIAIHCMEKQIAKAPKDINSIKFTGSIREQFTSGNCPCCNNDVDTDDDFKYCSECGQKLEWEN